MSRVYRSALPAFYKIPNLNNSYGRILKFTVRLIFLDSSIPLVNMDPFTSIAKSNFTIFLLLIYFPSSSLLRIIEFKCITNDKDK